MLEGEAALVRRRWQWWLEQNSHLIALVDGAGGWCDVKDVPETMAAQAMAELSTAASTVVARTVAASTVAARSVRSVASLGATRLEGVWHAVGRDHHEVRTEVFVLELSGGGVRGRSLPGVLPSSKMVDVQLTNGRPPGRTTVSFRQVGHARFSFIRGLAAKEGGRGRYLAIRVEARRERCAGGRRSSMPTRWWMASGPTDPDGRSAPPRERKVELLLLFVDLLAFQEVHSEPLVRSRGARHARTRAARTRERLATARRTRTRRLRMGSRLRDRARRLEPTMSRTRWELKQRAEDATQRGYDV